MKKSQEIIRIVRGLKTPLGRTLIRALVLLIAFQGWHFAASLFVQNWTQGRLSPPLRWMVSLFAKDELQAATESLTIGTYQLVGSTRVSRTEFDYTYKATLTNAGPEDTPDACATVTSRSAKTKIIEGRLYFGSVLAGMSKQSLDTFTIRQDRTVLFNSADLVWAVHSDCRPVANAGPDQTVLLGQPAYLDGSGSTDMDGQELTFHWQFVSRPPGSTAALSDPTAVNPTFAVDQPGTYTLQLVVNNGRIDSAPDTVLISTQNSKPEANAGPDQTVPVGRVFLDGSGSRDSDGDVLTYRWAFLSIPPDSTTTLDDATTANPSFLIDKPGSYTVQLIVNDGKGDSDSDTVVINTRNSAPVASAGADQMASIGQTVQLNGSGSSDVDGDALTYQWSFTTVPTNSNAVLSDLTIVNPTFVPDVAGLYVVQLIVRDGQVDSTPDTAEVTVIVAGGCIPGTTQSCYSGPAGTEGVGQCQAGTQTCGNDGRFGGCMGEILPGTEIPHNSIDEDCNGQDAACTPGVTQPCYTGPAETQGVGQCQDGVQTCQADATFGACEGQTLPGTEISDNGLDEDCDGADQTSGGEGLPPNPSTVAPPVDQSVVTTTSTATAFLYTGANPIQTGVAPGTIEFRRAAVLRGKVLDKHDAPLSGVTISILNHPEFGQTLSRTDGMFDLAVNGGGLLTINYQKTGLLPAQRQVDVPWQDYVMVLDVMLIPVDPQVTAIDLTSNVPVQVAQGSRMSDADGSRQATLLFPQGTQAQLVMPDGSTQPLSTLSVRATEYTVGPDGPKMMPAELPPTSGYTYAVELSVDEALAAGATEVRFDRPVSFYVDNFLSFPVGMAVPVGYYDRTRGQWIPSDNGRIIKILSETGGQADLDVTGDGAADTGATLTALGITDAERERLAALYIPGQSLWRVPITHFSAWDCNWPYGPPPPPPPPPPPGPPDDDDNGPDDKCPKKGSIIRCLRQVLGEVVPIIGTGFRLYYGSDRVPGRVEARTLRIRLSDPVLTNPPPKRIELEINIAGQAITQTFAPAPNLTYEFVWDGKDAYGRPQVGSHIARVRVGNVHDAVYQTPAQLDQSFGALSGVPFTTNRARQEITIWSEWQTLLNRMDGRLNGLGGWSLSIHHVYDPIEKMLYLGDGERRIGDAIPAIATAAGGGVAPLQNGIPARQALIGSIWDLAVGPDGSFYIADTGRVRRVGGNGIITTIAGTGSPGFNGDGGPATAAQISEARGVAVGGDGSIYIADFTNGRIRKVGPNGIITTVAGNGSFGFSGDGGPATQAQLSPLHVAVGPDGSVYVANYIGQRVRRVGPDGIITTVAGGGGGGDNIPATQAVFVGLAGLAVTPDGSLYVTDESSRRIRRVRPDGIITTIAGTGGQCFLSEPCGDGGSATQATLTDPRRVALGTDGSLYVADTGSHRIRKISIDGIITTVAGTGDSGGFTNENFADGGFAAAVTIGYPTAVAISPDSRLYIGHSAFGADLPSSGSAALVRVATPTLPELQAAELLVASEDGSKVYGFNNVGRHLYTADALTGVVDAQFTYDSTGRLTLITDKDGNVTTIERDGSGKPTAIVSPYGQRTTLSLDANGYLASITNPAGEAFQMTYTSDGLLSQFTDPRGNASQMTYDAKGLLLRENDAAGGSQTLVRTDAVDGHSVARNTALGRTTTYQIERLATGAVQQVLTAPDGTKNQLVNETNGTQTTTLRTGVVYKTQAGPDPRFGMQAPLPTSQTFTTPGGLTWSATVNRTANLADSTNPLSLVTQTDTAQINGRTYTRVYNTASRTFTLTTPAGRQSTAILDAKGRLVQATVPGLTPVQLAYDSRGRLASLTQGSRTYTYAYDSQGFLSLLTDPLAQTLNFARDAVGRTTDLTRPDGEHIQFAYDANGNMVSLTPPGRFPHTFAFTSVDLLQNYKPPALGGGSTDVQATYNLDRQLTQLVRAGTNITVSYDAAGRVQSLTHPQDTVSMTYDTTGRLQALTTASGLGLSYSYDGGLLTDTTSTGPVTGTIHRTFDNNLRLTSRTINGANTQNFTYDADDLLTQAGALTLQRDTQNGLITGTTLGTVSDTRSFTSFGEWTSYSATAGGTPLFSTQYTYDQGGRITQKSETLGGTTNISTYSYDLVGRLSEVKQNGTTSATYTYDANGNRLSRTTSGGTTSYTYDAQDRLLTQSSVLSTQSYAYTANGDLQSKTVGGQTTTYSYDVLGNLRNVTLPGGTQIEYLIDGLNRRAGRKVNGTQVQGFLYQDQLEPIAELDGNNAIVSTFVYGSRPNVPEYMVKGGATYRIIADHLGSPRLVVDTTTGAVAQRLDYDEFGQITQDTNPGFQPFGFAGGLYDQQTKLVRFGARDYDAEPGHWTSKDAVGLVGGLNLYAYVNNDPVNWVDLTGRGPAAAGAVAVGAGAGASTGTGAGAGGALLGAGSAALAGVLIGGVVVGAFVLFVAAPFISSGLENADKIEEGPAGGAPEVSDSDAGTCENPSVWPAPDTVNPHAPTDLPHKPLGPDTELPSGGTLENPTFPKPGRTPRIPSPETPEGGFDIDQLPPGGSYL